MGRNEQAPQASEDAHDDSDDPYLCYCADRTVMPVGAGCRGCKGCRDYMGSIVPECTCARDACPCALGWEPGDVWDTMQGAESRDALAFDHDALYGDGDPWEG